MGNPSLDGAVSELVNLGIDRNDALACLKACDNDLSRAADYYYYYFVGDLQKARNELRWDGSLFHAPRGGVEPDTQDGHSYNNHFQSSFQIQSPDVFSGGGFEGTKSRPPSRASNRGGDSADFNGADPDLARALAASIEDSGARSTDVYGQQESGITGTHTSPTEAYFGPAPPNQEYDPSKWSLTTTTQAHEIFLDPSPADRRRNPGEPAFLRPAAAGNNLSALFTILNNIPAAREALLSRDLARGDYGYDDQWWNGQKTRTLRITNIGDEASQAPELAEEVMEVQRIMAFLSGTTRAYGSVENVVMGPKVQEHTQINPSGATFFSAWVGAIKEATQESDDERYTRAFFSLAMQCTRGKPEEKLNTEGFQVLDLISPQSEGASLYDLLDNLVFPTDYETDVFVKFAPVICAQIRPAENGIFTGCPTTIPTILYPNKYTSTWAEPVREVRKRIEEQSNLLAEIDLKEDKLRRYTRSGTAQYVQDVFEPQVLLEALIQHFSTEQEPKGLAEEGGSEDVTMSPQVDNPPGFLLLLKSILSQLESKLHELSLQKAEAQNTLRKLRSSFTSPEDLDPALPPLTRYSLRGLCADNKTVYVLVPSAMEQGLPAGGSSSSPGLSEEQWWCMSWGPPKAATSGWDDNPTLSYSVDKVTEEQVLNAASTTGDGYLLLVYANDEALYPEEGIDISLPVPLQAFVDRDNAAFEAELRPNSPVRKRHNDWLEDSGAAHLSAPGSPTKKPSSSGSSATLGMATPGVSRRGSLTEVEMTEGLSQRTVNGSNDIGQTIELLHSGREEMQERGGVSPVAMAFHMDFKGRDKDLDQEMRDADQEHVGDARDV